MYVYTRGAYARHGALDSVYTRDRASHGEFAAKNATLISNAMSKNACVYVIHRLYSYY